MASPLKSAKQTVNLATAGPKVSRIRRDPPPKLKEISIEERSERDQRMAVIGIAAFTMALMIIIFAASSWAGWDPSEIHLYVRQ
jgi:hypothetical protein